MGERFAHNDKAIGIDVGSLDGADFKVGNDGFGVGGYVGNNLAEGIGKGVGGDFGERKGSWGRSFLGDGGGEDEVAGRSKVGVWIIPGRIKVDQNAVFR